MIILLQKSTGKQILKDENFPKNDEIVLKDCSKDAYYIVTVYSSNNEIIDTIRVDVKAHHVLEKFY